MKPLCVVSCPIDTFSGYGARSRDFVKALIKVRDKDWDIKILPQRWGDCPMKALPQDDPLFSRFIPQLPTQPDIWMQITVPNEFQPAGKSLNIGVTAGIETTVFPGDFIEGCNRMDLNLFSSTFSKETFQKTKLQKRDRNTQQVVADLEALKPAEVVFEGLNTDVYHKNPKSSEILKDVKEDFCFLFTGHWLPGIFGEDRKNNGKLIETFLNTFKGSKKKKPALILKTNGAGHSIIDKEECLTKIKDIKTKFPSDWELPNIYLLHGSLSDEGMNKLYNHPKVKAFVSLTHGEGFGRPLLEATMTGLPVIASAWSGHVDFLSQSDSLLLGGVLEKVPDSQHWENIIIPEAQWFNVNEQQTYKALNYVFENIDDVTSRAKNLMKTNRDKFTLSKMVEKLDKIVTPHLEKLPQQVGLNLPKLKKVPEAPAGPKIKLPKLKKVTSEATV